MTAQITIAMAQANPTVGDVAGNLALARRLRAHARRGGAPISWCCPSWSWSATRPRTWCSSRPSASTPAHAAGASSPRDTADGGPALIVGRALARRAAGSTTPCCCCRAVRVVGRALQARPAELRRVRREAGVRGRARSRARWLPAAGRRRQSASACMVCEDMWTEDVAEGLGESGRRDPDRAERLAVRARQAGRAPAARGGARHRDRPAADLLSTRSAARTSWCSTARSFALDADRRLVAQAPGFVEDADAHPLAARRRTSAWSLRRGRRSRRRSPDLEAIYRAMVPGPARLCRQEPLSGRGARPVGRHRFGALGGGRGRRARAGAGARRDDAVALHLARQPRGRRGRSPQRSASASTRCRSSRRWPRSATCSAPVFAGRAPDIDRGEHPVAHPRRDPDGDLQQARLHGADHRQQVRDVGRLRHALRRHVRRLLGAEGRLQDHRVRALRAGATQHLPDGRARARRRA